MTGALSPRFLTNRVDRNQAVGKDIKGLLSTLRGVLADSPSLSIATAYINPGGYALLAEELNQAPKVRLLLGAEPQHREEMAMLRAEPYSDRKLGNAVHSHENWLAAERDALGFSREALGDAKAFVDWLESTAGGEGRVEVRRFADGFLHGKAFILDNPVVPAVIAGSSNMTYAGLALNAELNLLGDSEQTRETIDWFEHYWALSDPYDLAGLYRDIWAPHSPWTVFMRMLFELYGGQADEERPKSRFGLAGFQADGVIRMERLLDQLGGVLVSDEVGLGKSFLAGEIIKKATEEQRQKVLIVAPAAIKASMWDPFLKTYGFNRLVEVLSFDEVRLRMDPSHKEHVSFKQDIEELSLVVVDEAHNLRSSSAQRSVAVDEVILAGAHPKKVVLLTATPVNNSLMDLDTLLRYFVRNDAQFAAVGIPSMKQYLKRAQQMDPDSLSPEHLFDLMDQVAVKRTRKFIREHYPHDTITLANGQQIPIVFPDPKPRRIEYALDDVGNLLVDRMLEALTIDDDHDGDQWSYQNRKANPEQLMLARYLSSRYLKTNKLDGTQLTNAGLLRSALLKRLESSPKALSSTLGRILSSHQAFLEGLEQGHVLTGEALNEWVSSESDNLNDFLELLDEDALDGAASIDDYHADDLIADVKSDMVLLAELRDLADDAASDDDPKFRVLLEDITNIAAAARREDPSRRGLSPEDRRKVIIFSSYSDTVEDIHDRLTRALSGKVEGALEDYVGRLAEPIMGATKRVHDRGESGGVDQGKRAQAVQHFAPRTASPSDGSELPEDLFDILVTTDVLAEGVNLQQAGRIINYDLPWNPMRIVQRHGRVDRIGSQHQEVDLGLFFPARKLDDMLKLEDTIQRKLAQAEAAVGVTISVFSKRPGIEVNLADRGNVEQFRELLEERGAGIAQSGEEYRRRLFKYLNESPANKPRTTSLPLGIGSGFVNPLVQTPGYVFCVRVGESEKPWFRFVGTNEQWDVTVVDGEPAIDSEALTSLMAADPVRESTERQLPDLAYEKAFDAWSIAREHVFEEWMSYVDPLNLEPDIPKAFRDAHAFVRAHGNHLSQSDAVSVLKKLKSVPSATVNRQMRQVLRAEKSTREIVDDIRMLLQHAGIQEAPEISPLPEISKDQVELVAWIAVSKG